MGNICSYDVIIIGSGAAGLTLALRLSPHLKVAVLSKSKLTEASTYYAQGGVAAVLDDTDSYASHVDDTLIAGAGLCHRDAVEMTVEHGPEAVNWLMDQGVRFTTADDSDEPHLTREGGHSHRRILHVADATGLAISSSLIEQVSKLAHVDLLEDKVAIDLITRRRLGLAGPDHVLGVYVLDKTRGDIDTYAAPFVALCCGGASKAYLYTTNPDIATGDGVAMAWRAGCRVSNLEFNQFHPTCLYHPEAKSFLITEAMRGEGGVLTLPNGDRFMQRFDPRCELAPRDVVARAIDFEMKRLGIAHVLLDISHRSADFIRGHFPTLYERLLGFDIDITRDPIPVVPAAHYTCGGVITNLQAQTDVNGLFAIGETASTGLHGANRMASNSLLECIVFARAAADSIHQQCQEPLPPHDLPIWDGSQVRDPDEDVVIAHNWDELRRFMWDYVGIVRTNKRLQRALNRVQLLRREIHDYYSNYRVSNDLIELRNLTLVSELIIRSAMARHESRGLHYILDYPNTANEARDTILNPSAYGF